jgi:hypothetical protein
VERIGKDKWEVIFLNRTLPWEVIDAWIARAFDMGFLPQGTVHQHVGHWTWLSFPEKPERHIREKLFEAGFFWNPRATARAIARDGQGSVWCHKHGVKSRGHLPKDFDPRLKYSTETLNSILVEKE